MDVALAFNGMILHRGTYPANCKMTGCDGTWLPDGYSQILRSYVFGPSGFLTMAPLRYAAKFDPFLSLDCAPRPPPWRNPRKGRNQILQRSVAEP